MISSTSNQQIKNIQALQKKAKERKKQSVFVAEGPRMCFESPRDLIQKIYVSESFSEETRYSTQLKEFIDCIELVSDQVFKCISQTQTPQGVLAVIKQPHYELEQLLDGERTMLLILEDVQDPGNLGTMIRTGEGAGVTGVIASSGTVDLFNPKTVRSTMGAMFRVPFFVAEDLKETIHTLKKNGISLYAAHLKGVRLYDEPNYTKACGFLIGNEGNGLSDEIADMADEYIKIPMSGSVESLNAAVSASLLMYECNRQRRRN